MSINSVTQHIKQLCTTTHQTTLYHNMSINSVTQHIKQLCNTTHQTTLYHNMSINSVTQHIKHKTKLVLQAYTKYTSCDYVFTSLSSRPMRNLMILCAQLGVLASSTTPVFISLIIASISLIASSDAMSSPLSF